MTNLNKFRELSWDDRRLLFQSVLLLPLIHFGLLLLGYSRLHTLMKKLNPLKSSHRLASETQVLQQAQEVTRIVSIAAQHGIYKATCLRRSLLVWWFLCRKGIPSVIRFGVRMRDQELEAHAWLEYKGLIVNDSSQVCERYMPLVVALPPGFSGL